MSALPKKGKASNHNVARSAYPSTAGSNRRGAVPLNLHIVFIPEPCDTDLVPDPTLEWRPLSSDIQICIPNVHLLLEALEAQGLVWTVLVPAGSTGMETRDTVDHSITSHWLAAMEITLPPRLPTSQTTLLWVVAQSNIKPSKIKGSEKRHPPPASGPFNWQWHFCAGFKLVTPFLHDPEWAELPQEDEDSDTDQDTDNFTCFRECPVDQAQASAQQHSSPEAGPSTAPVNAPPIPPRNTRPICSVSPLPNPRAQAQRRLDLLDNIMSDWLQYFGCKIKVKLGVGEGVGITRAFLSAAMHIMKHDSIIWTDIASGLKSLALDKMASAKMTATVKAYGTLTGLILIHLRYLPDFITPSFFVACTASSAAEIWPTEATGWVLPDNETVKQLIEVYLVQEHATFYQDYNSLPTEDHAQIRYQIITRVAFKGFLLESQPLKTIPLSLPFNMDLIYIWA
ncbi:hypothetical protein BDP27DRAFT_1372278 [Rhodocollybia butyracea]|uniref:Uncharacterized protein n=1 Tax=Rhodocollybia butyracea TaxID=206335 RepID=A0A9P5TXF9_9AGAR|nr:hypothetical protein BDP27DRAFT_1372278 [Rhodocollybia butyracea]